MSSPDELRVNVLEKISAYNFGQLANDVAPFLIHKYQTIRVAKFLDFWEQVTLI